MKGKKKNTQCAPTILTRTLKFGWIDRQSNGIQNSKPLRQNKAISNSPVLTLTWMPQPNCIQTLSFNPMCIPFWVWDLTWFNYINPWFSHGKNPGRFCGKSWDPRRRSICGWRNWNSRCHDHPVVEKLATSFRWKHGFVHIFSMDFKGVCWTWEIYIFF